MNPNLDPFVDLLAQIKAGQLSPLVRAAVPTASPIAHGFAPSTAAGTMSDLARIVRLGPGLDVFASAARPGVLVLSVAAEVCLGTMGDVRFDAEWGAILQVANEPAALAVTTEDGLRLVVATAAEVSAYAWPDEPSAFDALDAWTPPASTTAPPLPHPTSLLPDGGLPDWMNETITRLMSGDAVEQIAALGTVARLEPTGSPAETRARLLAGDLGAAFRVQAVVRQLPAAWVAECVELGVSRAALLADAIDALPLLQPDEAYVLATSYVHAREDLAAAWTALLPTGRAGTLGKALDDLDRVARRHASAFPPLPLLATDPRMQAARHAATGGWWTEWLT